MYPYSKKENLLLFHGTTSDNINSIRTGIDLNECKLISDFGRGFYLTDNYKQAIIWANKMANLKNKNSKSSQVKGVIIGYEINLYKTTKMNILEYDNKNMKWSKFIFDCRTAKLHQFDIVYGPVADGTISKDTNISKLLKDYRDKKIGSKEFHEKISDGFPWPENNQISFHSEMAISFLKFKLHWEV